MEGAVTPEGGRRTRAALAEIPVRLDRLRVTPLQPVTNIRERSPALPAGYLSPAPSPDELLIQQRGNILYNLAPMEGAVTLAEIPVRLDRLRVTPLQPVTNIRERSPALPAGYLSPAPSPDELLIQQRGNILYNLAPMEGAVTLAEIPVRLDRLRVTPLQPVTNIRERSPALPAGYLSPAPSPDELLIQQRGNILYNLAPMEGAVTLAEIPVRLDRLRVTPLQPVTNIRERSPALPAGYLSPAPSPDELLIQQRGNILYNLAPMEGAVTLAEIPVRLDRLRVTPLQPVTNIRERSPALPAGYLSPAPSPDELLIQQRGNILYNLAPMEGAVTLAEIPVRLDRLRVTPLQPVTNIRERSPALPAGYLSPAPSPDELLIQQRGNILYNLAPMEGAVTLAEIPVRLDRLRVTPLQPVTSIRERSPALPAGYLSPAPSPDELLIQQRGNILYNLAPMEGAVTLAEIPVRLDRLRVTPLQPVTNIRERSPALPAGYLSPAPSPDELLIQQRGNILYNLAPMEGAVTLAEIPVRLDRLRVTPLQPVTNIRERSPALPAGYLSPAPSPDELLIQQRGNILYNLAPMEGAVTLAEIPVRLDRLRVTPLQPVTNIRERSPALPAGYLSPAPSPDELLIQQRGNILYNLAPMEGAVTLAEIPVRLDRLRVTPLQPVTNIRERSPALPAGYLSPAPSPDELLIQQRGNILYNLAPMEGAVTLAEIPVRLDRLRVTPLQPVTNIRERSPALPAGYLSPAPSPDELLIQQRGNILYNLAPMEGVVTLAEIPVRLDRLRVTPLQPVNNIRKRSPALPAGYLSPAPSPDELLIQQRGNILYNLAPMEGAVTLAEIPVRLDRLRVTPLQPVTNIRERSPALPAGYLSLAPSPDELLIQQRGNILYNLAPMEGAVTLAEIPVRLDRLRVTPLQPVTNIRERSPALPAGYLSPAPSPDELLIQQRGNILYNLAPMEGAVTLAEIPVRLDRLRVTPLQPVTNIRERSPALPAGYLSPAPSPDELLIQQRGNILYNLAPMEGAVTLAEIPVRLDRLRVTTLQPVTNIRERSPALPAGYLSPAPSPDELLIQQRGRKRLPVTWSPDIELKRNSSFHSTVRTPPKDNHLSPLKLGVTLRSTPRKRLLLDNERIPLTPEKIDFSDISTPQKFKITSPIKSTPPMKRSRLEKSFSSEFKGPLDTALKGLSPTQLIHMIKTITYKHPEIEQEIRSDMPIPDITPLEERLSYLKSNIFKSLPTSRLTSKTDSPAYARVSTHLAAFKKCVIDQGKVLVESQHWESVIEYVFLAWNYVKATPVWDNQPHNAQRKQCFKALTTFCMTALKKGNLERDLLIDAQDKLQGMVADSEEISSCLKYVQGQLQDYL